MAQSDDRQQDGPQSQAVAKNTPVFSYDDDDSDGEEASSAAAAQIKPKSSVQYNKYTDLEELDWFDTHSLI